jgi:hypothetical protein
MTLLLAVYSQAAIAVEDSTPEAGIVTPDPEFLEFLGRFETDNGEWLDPIELLEPAFDQFLNRTEQQNELPGSQSATNAPEDQTANQNDE